MAKKIKEVITGLNGVLLHKQEEERDTSRYVDAEGLHEERVDWHALNKATAIWQQQQAEVKKKARYDEPPNQNRA
ncbi:MAG: hypothetical protein LLG04_15825 [Parachlamydia sp.]|nr:hypothetical protein [Parachlamydia sp.]